MSKVLQSLSAGSGRRSEEFYDQKHKNELLKRHQILDERFVHTLLSKYEVPFECLVLDVGCGTGWYSHLLAKHSRRVVGVDISRTAILRAKREWKEKRIDWVVGDARHLSFDSIFDVVFCSGLSLFNIPDLKTSIWVAGTLFNHLKTGGLFIFVESSNLSERETTVANHSLRQVSDFFTNLNFASVVGTFALNVQLLPLLGDKALSHFSTKLTSTLLRIHRKSCRVVCVCRKL